MRLSQKRYRGRRAVVVAVASIAAAGAGVALASDTIFPDGDTGVSAPNLAYGSGAKACSSLGTAVAGEVSVDYNGNGGDHFAPGESLSVTYGTPAGITVTQGTVPNVPSTWGDEPQDSFDIPFTTTVSSAIADGSYQVDVTVKGNSSKYEAGDGAGSGRPHYQVIVNCSDGGGGGTPNATPTVGFTTGPASVVEGATATYGLTVGDTDGDPVSFAAGSPTCGSLGVLEGSSIDNTNHVGSVTCSFADGVVPATTSELTAQVTDGAAFSTTATKNVTVNNANPVVSAITATGSGVVACTSGNTVGLSYSFSDAGLIDSPWGTDINWGDGSTHSTASVLTQGAQGPVSHLYGAGTWTPGVTVTDKDTGSGSSATGAGAPTVTLLYSSGAGILQPINYTGARSLFKIGSTIPVKVKIVDCDGNPVSGLALNVALKYTDPVLEGATATEDVVSTVPDQGTLMRYTGAPDNQYIFNLNTKGKNGGEYTVTVSGTTIAPITATIGLKK